MTLEDSLFARLFLGISNLLPEVRRGAQPFFYLYTFSLTGYMMYILHRTYMPHIRKRKAVYRSICCIELLLLFIIISCISVTAAMYVSSLILDEDNPPRHRFKDWVRFYGVVLVESLTVVLLLEISLRSRRSGKFIFKQTSSATGYVNLQGLVSCYFSGIRHVDALQSGPKRLLPLDRSVCSGNSCLQCWHRNAGLIAPTGRCRYRR